MEKMENGKKKHSTKMATKSRPSLGGYWDAPPVVPIQNIRSTLTSLEKELELLCGAKETRQREEEAMKHALNVNKPTPEVALITNAQSEYLTRPVPQAVRQTVSNVSPRTSIARTESSVPRAANSVHKTTVSMPHSPITTRQSSFDFDRYKRYKTRILQAYQDRKIFTIYGYYPALKSSLLSRGWIEKLPHDSRRSLQQLSPHSLILNARNGNDYETAVLSKMLESYPSYFIWQPKYHYDFHNYVTPHRNRIKLNQDFDFTTKEGLVACINRALASSTLGVAQILYPRTYRLAYKDEVNNFEQNFRLTHCLNLLLYVSEKPSQDEIFSSTGEVDISCLHFALKRIEKEISIKKNEPNDWPDLKNISNQEWKNFLDSCDKIMNKNLKVMSAKPEENIDIRKVKQTIAEAKKYFPTFKMDGYANVWIMKPSDHCRGDGITLMTDMHNILNYAKKNFKLRYIVQKYIERPLLIYKTKFDIRQYVLVTINETITIYLYKDCYVKFSSQEFDLKNLHESVHVTNFAVQSKYKNGTRSDLLPPHNMWSLIQLKNYFKTINKDNIWENCVFPKMKETAIAIILASLDSAYLITNAFELFGIDFMLTEDFEPVILEINATPDMSKSTCVTAQICPATLEDVVKVVVDNSRNPKASIGNFEAVYRVPWSKTDKNKSVIVRGVNLIKPNLGNAPKFSPVQPTIRTAIIKQIPPKTNNTYRKQIPAKTTLAIKRNPYTTVPFAKNVTIKPKTNPHLVNSTAINRNEMIANSADAFLKQFVEIVKSVHCLTPNGPKKDVIANRVHQVIESIYDVKKKHNAKQPPIKPSASEGNELKISRRKQAGANSQLGKMNIRRKDMTAGDEKILKSFIEVVYNKMWK